MAKQTPDGVIRADDIPARQDEYPELPHNAAGEIDLSDDDITNFAKGSAKALKTMAEKFQNVAGLSDITATHFWTCLVFAGPEQRDEFLAAIERLGVKIEDEGRLYLPGYSVAKALGVSLTHQTLPRKERNDELDSLALPIK